MNTPGYLRTCLVDDCSAQVGMKAGKGLCPRHYQRMLATGSPVGTTMPVDKRFFAKVVESGDCWVWTASRDDSGYGLFKAHRMIRAHIWSYEFFVGPVPAGLQLDHLCHDVSCELGVDCPHRRCVNPAHLEPVPGLTNTRRGRGARRSRCPVRHAYDLDNTYINPKGAQVCRTCMATYRARYDAKKRAA